MQSRTLRRPRTRLSVVQSDPLSTMNVAAFGGPMSDSSWCDSAGLRHRIRLDLVDSCRLTMQDQVTGSVSRRHGGGRRDHTGKCGHVRSALHLSSRTNSPARTPGSISSFPFPAPLRFARPMRRKFIPDLRSGSFARTVRGSPPLGIARRATACGLPHLDFGLAVRAARRWPCDGATTAGW